MEAHAALVPPDPPSQKTRGLLVAGICLAASLGFVTLGGGALVGVLFAITWAPLSQVEKAHLDIFVLVLYGVAIGCFAVAVVILFIGLRKLLRA